jgi:hypothetical protein
VRSGRKEIIVARTGPEVYRTQASTKNLRVSAARKLHREVMNQAIVDWTEEMNLMTLQLGRAPEGPIQESKSAKHIDNRKSVKSD